MILLMLDYDGTLCPIRSRPEQARLSSAMLNLLDLLGRSPDIIMGIISGRRITELKKLVPVAGIYYAGCHGLEICGPGMNFVHHRARAARPSLKALSKDLSRLGRRFPGMLVEDKGLSVAAHFRRVKPDQRTSLDAEISELKMIYPGLVCRPGRKVYDFRPDAGWDKGQAVRLLLDKLKKQKPFPVYMGDDATDEDAFKALLGIGLTILVASRERGNGRTAAVCRISSVAKVRGFLKSLIQ